MLRSGPPTCNGIDKSTAYEQPVSVALDCGGSGPLDYALVAPVPSHGTISNLDPDAGTLVYTPSAGYSGADSFGYEASNAAGSSDPATVTVEVGAPPAGAPTPTGPTGKKRCKKAKTKSAGAAKKKCKRKKK